MEQVACSSTARDCECWPSRPVIDHCGTPDCGSGLCEACRVWACMAARRGLCTGLLVKLSLLSRLGGGEVSACAWVPTAAAICQLCWLRSGSSRPSKWPTGPLASMSSTCQQAHCFRGT